MAPAKKSPASKSRSPKPRATKAAAARSAKSPAAAWTLASAMAALEKAGTAQNRKTYARHGAAEPMFGVSFADMAKIRKSVGADHDLARALWDTGNHDARILALKVADPARTTQADLEKWASESGGKFLGNYVAQLAAETPHGAALAAKWLAAPDAPGAGPGWALVGQLAMTDTATPDSWFEQRLAEIQSTILTAPDRRREAMNHALISIGCRSAALRKAALAAAKRVGKVDVDHGDTSCRTPDAASYIEKTWAHSTSKGFESPAAHERSREPIRLRC
jgi:3-methyladenine DNA glycosylase AlkD